MSAGRTWASLVVVLAVAMPAAAQSYSLSETPQTGQCFQLHLEMKLIGAIHRADNDKAASIPLEATASHDFVERIMDVQKSLPQKTARVYETAQVAIQAGSSQQKRTLRPDRALIVVQRTKDQGVVYCPKGTLTREEVELTAEHFDTLALTGLLPGKEVAVNDTWKIPTEVVQALCHFEGLKEQDLVCKLEEVKDNVALVRVSGSASGIDLGALAKLTIQATYQYDLTQRQLVGLEWKQKDERTEAPASPASLTESTYVLKRKAIDQPKSLSDVELVSVPEGEIPEELLQLAIRDPRGRFEFAYDRDWHVTSRTDESTVLRLMERGDFVAQVTITSWTKARAGEHLSAEEFQRAMAAGWKQEQILKEGVVATTDAGRWIYQISAVGTLEGLKVVQVFYLVAAPGGEQVVLAFTTAHNQVEKLATRDLTIVSGLKLPAK